jgi:hypothetical protein
MEDDMKSFTRRNTGIRLAQSLGVIVCVLVVVATTIARPAAQNTAQKTFASPGEAVQAMYSAAKTNDTAALIQIFGPSAKDVLSSGDPVADKNDRQKAVEKYEQMHRLVTEPDKTTKLYLGAENWPFPIPLVEKNGVWFFDTEAGKKEIFYRRIGRNEYATIEALDALVAAEKEYASVPRDNSSVKQYAQKLLSDEGMHNGLFWRTEKGEPQSPIGPLIAAAAAQGYSKAKEGPTPFHGYLYRLLQSQGNNAPGGAMSYMSDGKMTRGFAIVAYPAKYRNSGVMTFIVNQDGQVYQKDLGPRTATIVGAMTQYDPDKTWIFAE